MTTTSTASILSSQRKKRRKKPPSSQTHLLNKRTAVSHKSIATGSQGNQSSILPSKLSRQLIRTHHILQKQLAQALSDASPDQSLVSSIRKQIDDLGGLEKYQQASISGQNTKRGGDSSRVLVQWLKEENITKETVFSDKDSKPKYRLLEIGCLSPNNDISKCGVFGQDFTRIDLNSVHPKIQKCDFMELPIPDKEDDRYDLISLSLVLNYVPDPAGRGDMLARTVEFLRTSNKEQALQSSEDGKVGSNGSHVVFPGLFLVLPAPCVSNSRYLTEKRLTQIMQSLGYELMKNRVTPKLVYYLWKWHGIKDQKKSKLVFKKEEIVSGGGRNNFAIVMK